MQIINLLPMSMTICLLTGCGYVDSISRESAPSTHGQEIQSQTNQTEKNDDKNSVINPSGWIVPKPDNMRRVKTTIVNMVSDTGADVQVKSTLCEPVSKFKYREKDVPGNHRLLPFAEDLELVNFVENKIGEKVFGYTITSRLLKSNVDTNSTSIHRITFVYRIIDNDGDGKFESLLTNNATITVPAWALR